MKVFLKSALCLLLCLAMLLPMAACKKSSSDDGCVDGACTIPEQDEHGNQVYAMVSPVGHHNVEMLEQAPRLVTLCLAERTSCTAIGYRSRSRNDQRKKIKRWVASLTLQC